MITYKDIAKVCGVSTATVSYVFNGKGHISQEMRDRIFQTAEAMGYVCKHRTLGHKIIRLYCADLKTLPTHVFFNELLTGVFSVTEEAGYDVIVTPAPKAYGEEGRTRSYDETLADGILVIDPKEGDPFLEYVSRSGCPCIVVGRPDGKEDKLCYVDVDNVAVGYQITSQMLAHQHKDILFLNGPEKLTISQDRLTGYRMAMNDYKVAVNGEQILYAPYTSDCACQAVTEYLQTHSRPTAVIANSDNLALGAMMALSNAGIRIPEECSVICAGESILSKTYPIPISGVDIHSEEIGSQAARMLINLIDKRLIRVTQYHVPFTYNDRGSIVQKL